jgi:hypothetical protein
MIIEEKEICDYCKKEISRVRHKGGIYSGGYWERLVESGYVELFFTKQILVNNLVKGKPQTESAFTRNSKVFCGANCCRAYLLDNPKEIFSLTHD